MCRKWACKATDDDILVRRGHGVADQKDRMLLETRMHALTVTHANFYHQFVSQRRYEINRCNIANADLCVTEALQV